MLKNEKKNVLFLANEKAL